MRIVLLFIIAIFFNSCDPADNRLVFNNSTGDSLIVRLMFNEELPNNSHNWNRSREFLIIPSHKNQISIFNKWEGEFKRALPEKSINVIVAKHYDFESNPSVWDSLYKSEKLLFKKYELEELKKNNWKINYPEDGFDLLLN